MRLPEQFVPQTVCESLLLGALDDLSAGRSRLLSIEAPSNDSILSATLLRWFLLEAVPAVGLPVFRCEIGGATLEGLLDLSGATLKVVPRFLGCSFPLGLDLTEACTGGFQVIGGAVGFVRANRLVANGALILRAPLAVKPGGSHAVPNGRLVIEEDVQLSGARVRGNVDMRGCRLGRARTSGRRSRTLQADGLEANGNVLLSDGFRATGEICLDGARIGRNLDFSGAVLRNPGGYSVSAAGAQIAGSLYTRRQFSSRGAFRLEGARINGDWRATSGRFVAAAFSDADWTPASGKRLAFRAILATGLTVHATVRLDAGFHVRGILELINAKIEGDFNCNGGIFDFPGEETLYADGITISGAFFLEEARINGLLRLVQATIGQGLFANKTAFDLTGRFRDRLGAQSVSAEELGLDVCGVYASAAKIGGPFYWRRIRKIDDPGGYRRLLLSVLDATAETVEDDPASWELLDQIDVRNCRYGSIADLTGDTIWRVDLLDRAYAPLNQFPRSRAVRRTALRRNLVALRSSLAVLWSSIWGRRRNDRLAYAILTFAPQPYIQLARVVHQTGYEAVASDIMVRMERNRTRYSGFGFWRQLGRWISDLLARYGFAPLRPVWFLLGWTVISAVVFEYAYANGRMVPTYENLEKLSASNESSEQPRYGFNPVVYALDTLVPLIDLNQKKNWHVEPLLHMGKQAAVLRAEEMRRQPASLLGAVSRLHYSLPNDAVGWLVLFNTFFGWVLTTFLAAGVAGVMRSKPVEGGVDSNDAD